jgi:hypothetical protein
MPVVLSVTEVASSVQLAEQGSACAVIANDGPSTAYVRTGSEVTVATGTAVRPGIIVKFGLALGAQPGWVTAICQPGETASLRISGPAEVSE